MRNRFCALLLSALGLICVPARGGEILTELGSAGPGSWAIVTDSTNPHLNGPGTTNGNVAVAQPNAVLALDSSNTYAINGNVSLAPGATISHPNEVNGSIFTNVDLSGVITDATNAAAFFGAQAATSGITSINNSTGTINATGLVTVLDVSSFSLGTTLTLNGTSADQFIINITGGMKLTSGKITLTGGLTPADVVFNIQSGDLSTSGGLNHESVITGIVLAGANSQIHMSPGLINGELISLTTGTFQIVSGGSVNQMVPEPATYCFAGLGLLLLAGIAYHRRIRLGRIRPARG